MPFTNTDTGTGTDIRLRGQVGSASIWALALTAGAFTVLLGLVVDGGRVIDARVQSSQVAAQAARAAADTLSQASVRSGDPGVAAGPAANRARTYLRSAGMDGRVTVVGETVRVTVTGHSDTEILGILGIESFPIRETRTARAITEEDTP